MKIGIQIPMVHDTVTKLWNIKGQDQMFVLYGNIKSREEFIHLTLRLRKFKVQLKSQRDVDDIDETQLH